MFVHFVCVLSVFSNSSFSLQRHKLYAIDVAAFAIARNVTANGAWQTVLYGCRRSSSQAAERDGRLHCPWVHSSVPASASTASVCLWSRWCPIIGLPLPDKSYPADNLPVKIRPARQPTGRGGFLLASYRPGRDFWGTII